MTKCTMTSAGYMKQNAQRRADTAIIKQNTQLCMIHKMRVTNEAVNQAAVPPLATPRSR